MTKILLVRGERGWVWHYRVDLFFFGCATWTIHQTQWCATSKPQSYVWSTCSWTTAMLSSYRMLCGHKYLGEPWLMTARKVLFECLHVTELYISFTLLVVLKSVFSNSATCSSSSLHVKRRESFGGIMIKKMGVLKRKQKLFLKWNTHHTFTLSKLCGQRLV